MTWPVGHLQRIHTKSCRSHADAQTSYQYQSKLTANPSWNCSIAYSTDAYDYYRGTTSK
jgi:hypothetical protein